MNFDLNLKKLRKNNYFFPISKNRSLVFWNWMFDDLSQKTKNILMKFEALRVNKSPNNPDHNIERLSTMGDLWPKFGGRGGVRAQ